MSTGADGTADPAGRRSSGSVGIGVIGARSMVARLAVLPAIEASTRVHLAAAASLGGPLAEPWSAVSMESYEAVIDHPDVAAVYIPLPNGMHEAWVERCAAAGKHILCEKPLAPTPDAARRMRDVANDAGVLLAEAWMTRFDPRWTAVMRLVSSGLIGRVTEVHSTFTFTIGPEAADNYRWDPEQGGGALLDVGIYCLGPAVQLWGPTPTSIDATARLSPSGVDGATRAELTWPNGEVASITCSFIDDETQRLVFVGTGGSLALDGDAHTGGVRAAEISHTMSDGSTSTITVPPGDPYLAMVDAFAAAISKNSAWDRPTGDSIAMLELIDRIAQTAAAADTIEIDETQT